MFNGWRTLGPIGSAVGLWLWVTAPIPGNAASSPHVLKNINAQGSAEPGEFIPVGGRVYFRADDGVHGSELWRSDGSERGTVLVADVNPGSSSGDPTSFVSFDGRVFFSATSPATGREVWFADERRGGARVLKDINPGPSDGINPLGFLFLAISDRLYFPALDEFGLELWISDGNPDGTRLIKDIHPGVSWSVPVFLTPLRGNVLFAADDRYTPGLLCWDRELWKSDGTAAGTVRVKDINAGPCASIPTGLTPAWMQMAVASISSHMRSALNSVLGLKVHVRS
jgi:ELWxxDGT repeat protein